LAVVFANARAAFLSSLFMEPEEAGVWHGDGTVDEGATGVGDSHWSPNWGFDVSDMYDVYLDLDLE
jgi:hypothetical protein